MTIGNHMTKSSFLISGCVLVYALVFGCTTIPEERILSNPNPTSFTFNSSEGELVSLILSEFGDFKFQEMSLSYGGSPLLAMDSIDIFDQPGNEKDFYLEFEHGIKENSFLYPGHEYLAGFHLHLRPVDDDHTEIIIYTINPQIIIGTELLPSGPHFVRAAKYMKVPPSTIEEYEILYKIGELLGQKMPPINYPE